MGQSTAKISRVTRKAMLGQSKFAVLLEEYSANCCVGVFYSVHYGVRKSQRQVVAAAEYYGIHLQPRWRPVRAMSAWSK